MSTSTQNPQASLNGDFTIGRVLSGNALVIHRARGIVRSAQAGWWTRVAVTCQAAVNHLMPMGYEDETGFHYGGMPVSNTARTLGPFRPTPAPPKIRPWSRFKAVFFRSALWESVRLKEKSKLPTRSGGLDKKSKKERPSQTTVFRYEHGIETASAPRSRFGK